MSSDQMPTPGKTKLIKFPPSRLGKDVKCPGYAREGGGFWSFDLTGTLRTMWQKCALYMYIYSYFNNVDRSKPKAYETRPNGDLQGFSLECGILAYSPEMCMFVFLLSGVSFL